mgnify:CR=1 FL=1
MTLSLKGVSKPSSLPKDPRYHNQTAAHMEVISEEPFFTVDGEILYTFEPHPRRVLQPGNDLRLLETFEQKVETLAALGLDAVIAEPFDLEFAKTSPEYFIEHCIWERIRPVEV